MRISLTTAVVLGGLLLLGAGLGHTQTVPGSLTLRWVLPTTGCIIGADPPVCGAPLTGDAALQAVHVWVDTSPIPDDPVGPPTLTLSAGATTAQHTLQVVNGQTLYARVSAKNAAGDSPLSNEVSKLIALDVLPGVPTDVTIELVIAGQ